MKIFLFGLFFTLNLGFSPAGFAQSLMAENPNDFRPYFGVGTLAIGLEEIATHAYAYKAKALRQWAKVVDQLSEPLDLSLQSAGTRSRIFLLYSLEEVMNGIHTPFMKDIGLVCFNASIRYHRQNFSRTSVFDFESESGTVYSALQAIRISLQASQDYLVDEEGLRSSYLNTIGNIAQAIGSSAVTLDKSAIDTVVRSFDDPSGKTLLELLKGNPRTESFYQVIITMRNWLALKVK